MELHPNFDTIAVRVHFGACGCIRVHCAELIYSNSRRALKHEYVVLFPRLNPPGNQNDLRVAHHQRYKKAESAFHSI
jgi:hypothetical protein